MRNMPTITNFTKTSNEVLLVLMDALEGPLGLPKGTFRELHTPDKLSGSETRIIRKPAEGESGHIAEGNKGGAPAAAIGAHTGELTVMVRRELSTCLPEPSSCRLWQLWVQEGTLEKWSCAS